MQDHQKEVSRMRFRIGLMLGLRAFITVLSLWLLTWGTAVLILRGAFDIAREPLLWGGAGILAAVVAGYLAARRGMPGEDKIRALLDHHFQCGGLLMATEETGTGAWPVKVTPEQRPSIRWEGQRHGGLLLFSTAFVLMTFLIPTKFFGEVGKNRLQVDQEIEKLAEQLEVLKEEKFLPPERAESLEVALKDLKKDAEGNNPAKTWEAMDHLENSLARASESAAESLAQEARKFAGAEELAAALNQAQSQLSPDTLSEAMKSLAEDLQRSAEETSALPEELSKELQELLKDGKLDAGQLAQLAKSLGKCKAGDLSKLKKLTECRMIDPSALEKLKGKCKIDPDALAKLLCECKGSGDLKACLSLCNKPGRGGITRGRGDAEMTWQDGSSKENAEFKERPLPPGAAATLKDATLQGLSVGTPELNDTTEVSAGGGLDPSKAGRGSARTQVILPEHKKVVQRYFDRGAAANSTKTETP